MKQKLHLLVITATFFVFTSYSFIRAYDESVWFPPAAGTAPQHNVATPINTGTDAQIKNGGLSVDALSVTGDAGITSAAPQILFNDTSGNNNNWWIHSNAYGSGPRMHFLYDRNNNGVWDAGDGTPAFIVQAGTAADGSDDKLFAPGQVNAAKYCNADGSVCANAGSSNLGYRTSAYYIGTKDIDTNVTKDAFCSLTAQNDGGCDTGASCGIAVEGDSWVVHQRAYGDCNGTMSCTYSCIGLPAAPSYTYSWSVGGWNVCYVAESCSTAGTQSRSVSCKRSDGSDVPDYMCSGNKPSTNQSCVGSRHGSDC